MASNQQQEELNKDLGLGSRVAQQSRVRFLNRDGSFNVIRKGFSFFRSQNVYHALLSMSWVKYQVIIIIYYFATNLLFAAAYLLCGPDALHGSQATTPVEKFLEAFFFSVQTLATIGYGKISPNGLIPNILVTIEALVGLLGFALITGLLFARFSRPSAKILYSNNALIAPYGNGTAFEFRIVNERSNQLIEVAATVVLSRIETIDGGSKRKFYPLTLEREKVMFLPLHWVIVHPITESSPLFGISKDKLDASDAEFLILLTGVDETFSQTVHSRSSYKYHEVVWGVKFSDMYQPTNGESRISIDLNKIHGYEPA
jgi:inward rectifier potassium channel